MTKNSVPLREEEDRNFLRGAFFWFDRGEEEERHTRYDGVGPEGRLGLACKGLTCHCHSPARDPVCGK